MTILISGGGIGGLCTAIALARHGLKTHLFEKAPEFSEVGAGIQIGPNGMRILEKWGLSDLLENRGACPDSIRISDGLSGQKLNEVPLGDHARTRYGAPYKVFHRAELQMALLEKARSLTDISITTDFEVTDFVEKDDGIQVHSARGEEQTGDLLIAADGLWSTVRSHFFPDLKPQFYGKSAWRAIVPTSEAPSPFNRQQTGLWMAPDAHLVHYPVMGGKAVNVVAVISEQFNRPGWTNEGRPDQLLAHYKDWHETPRNFLNGVSGWQKWALYSIGQLPGWSKGRVTLLGDAAHPPIPFLAQGGVMAIEDAWPLAELLGLYGPDYRRVFRQYEDLRRDRAAEVMKTADRLGKIYHMKGLMRRARNGVLRRKNPEKLLADYDWLYGFTFETSS